MTSQRPLAPPIIWSTRRLTMLVGIVALVLIAAPAARAAINFRGGGNSSWWFDPANWSQNAFGYIPPAQDDDGGIKFTGAQINEGFSVVYDPDNDPFFASAAARGYPTGSPIAGIVGSDYGPQHIYRFYISRNTTEKNYVTIKSGDLAVASTTIVGRSGSTASDRNLGQITQEGGRVRFPLTSMEIGQSESSGWGSGIYDYHGGTLEISLEGGSGLRIAHGRSSGPSGTARFIMRNSGPAGHVRVWDMRHISYRGSDTDGGFTDLDPNGVDRGVATTEFHFSNGGTRPVQVARNLTLNNGIEPSTNAVLSTRLDLVLDEAPTVTDGAPQNLGLADTNFDIGFGDNGGGINGFGDIDNDAETDAVFANHDGSIYYQEGDIVSAGFGTTKYNWRITYAGEITWDDADVSDVGDLLGPDSATPGSEDLILVGESVELNWGLVGDYNENGSVDAADYTVWRDQLGSTASLPNDILGGTIGEAQYNQWVANFGHSAVGGGAAAVPEPGCLALLALAAFGLIGCVRRLGRAMP